MPRAPRKKPDAKPAKPQGTSPVVRDAKGRIKGGSLNPGGQPEWVRKVKDALASRCAPLAESLLFDVLGDSEADLGERLKAADITLKYVVPKPTETLKIESNQPSPFAGLTPEMLLAIAKGKA